MISADEKIENSVCENSNVIDHSESFLVSMNGYFSIDYPQMQVISSIL